MSGICGIIRFDGGPVSREELGRMAGAATYRGLHGTSIHCDGPAGLVYQSLEITPESVGETQPVRGPRGTFLLADARVDNRGELHGEQVGRDGSLRSDAELILDELVRHPDDGPARVLGDFAWAIWEAHAQELRLVRDPMGMRALHYRVEPGRVLFATEVKQILAADGVPRQINELAVAWYLSSMQAPPDQVFYAGIESVLPGEEVVVSSECKVRKRIFWRPDPARRIRYRDEAEYADHLRELLVDSMRARLRTQGPVGVSLSGGLDSGAVASIAGWLRERGAPGAPKGEWPDVRAYTVTSTELPECDERENVYRIASRYGLPVHEIPAEEAWPLINYPAHGSHEDEPFISMFQPFLDLVADAAAAENVSVLFHGTRGDLMAGGMVLDIAGLVRAGELKAARRQLGLLRWHYGLSRATTLLRFFLRPALSPLIPAVLRRGPGETFSRAEPHVSRDFIQRAGLPERDPIEFESEPWRGDARRDRYRHVFTPLVMRAVTFLERLAAERGMGFADPWSDRRIAEFALAVPQHILHRVTDPKRIARRAVAGILPEERAAVKVVPTPIYERAIRTKARPTIEYLITNSRAAALGFVDEAILRQQYDEYLQSKEGTPVFDVWSFLSLEIWLRRYWERS